MYNKKGIKRAILLFLLLFLLPAWAGASKGDDMSIYIDEREYTFMPSPFIQEGRTLVPMRSFFEVMGAEVEWCNEERVASAYRDGVEISIPVDSYTPEVNGAEVQIEVSAEIVGGRTFVPLRFAAECFGCDVNWDEEKMAVAIHENGEETGVFAVDEEPAAEDAAESENETEDPAGDDPEEKEEEEKETEPSTSDTGEEQQWQVVSTQKGEASWYGSKFHGRGTASGETFDMYDYTAAHRTLPFNTRVRVTLLETDREVKVRINDRGPHIESRIIDLSKAAAEAIGLSGVGQVKLEVLEKSS